MKKLFDSYSEGSQSQNDVPWHSTYNKEKGVVGDEELLREVVVCTSGLLLITDTFKDFIFSGKKLYTYLTEALNVFVEKPSESIPIVLEVTSSRTADIGTIDGYEGNEVWIKTPKGYRFLSRESSTTPVSTTNPFLAPHLLVTGDEERSGGGVRSRKTK